MVERDGSNSDTVEFSDCSLHVELMVNTSKGNWTLAPSKLVLKIIVAQDRDLNQIISAVSRDRVQLHWFDIGQRNLKSLIPLKKMRI